MEQDKIIKEKIYYNMFEIDNLLNYIQEQTYYNNDAETRYLINYTNALVRCNKNDYDKVYNTFTKGFYEYGKPITIPSTNIILDAEIPNNRMIIQFYKKYNM